MASKHDLINALPRFFEVCEEVIWLLYNHPGDGLDRRTVILWTEAVEGYVLNDIELPDLVMQTYGYMKRFLADPRNFGNVKLAYRDEFEQNPDPKATVLEAGSFPDLRELVRRPPRKAH